MSPDRVQKVPRLSRWLLIHLTAYHERHSVVEDFEETFEEIGRASGWRKACRWYRINVIKSFPEYIKFSMQWRLIMFSNYLKTALRNIGRSKTYAFITVFGLAVGMMCALFILVFSENELSHDRFHDDIRNIQQVLVHTDIQNNAVTPTDLGPYLKTNFPEVVDATRYHWLWGETILQVGQNSYYEKGIRLVDPSFFKIFNFPFIEGDPGTALSDLNSIVLSQEFAEKYFGNEDPLGKTIVLNHEHSLSVTGVIRNVPAQSSMNFDMLMPFEFNIVNQREWYTAWSNLFVYTFIKCRDDIYIDAFNAKIEGIIKDQGGQEDSILTLLPFKDRYFFFYSDRSTVIVFMCVAVFILLIASFNFVNLSTALSMRRAKEIGMRKILGAQKKQIVMQYLGESILLAFIAAIISVFLFVLLNPVFQAIVGEEVGINVNFFGLCTFGIALLTGLTAGLYPAFFLSAFRISHILKKKQGSGLRRGRLRKGIVLIQFVLSLLLLLSMTIVYQQMQYIKNRGLGYQKDNVVRIPMGGGSEIQCPAFTTELCKETGVISVSGTRVTLPYFGWRINAFHWEGKDPEENISINYNVIDYDFIETMDLRLKEGRTMSRDRGTDAGSGIYINEKMAELMDMQLAAGSTIMYGEVPLEVIGVVEDFHFKSLANAIEPLILHLEPQEIRNVLVRIAPENRAATIASIKTLWENMIPGYPFQYSFLDEASDPSLTRLSRLTHLLAAFAVVAAVISCLGLFGLSSFMAEQSTKEIGIRKVHGASTISIIKQLSYKYILLVLMANMIVWPVAYYLMNSFLNRFAYKTLIRFPVFIIIAAVSVIIAFLSVGYKSFKAARANPVKALRYE